jgi:hypothetical protein
MGYVIVIKITFQKMLLRLTELPKIVVIDATGYSPKNKNL